MEELQARHRKEQRDLQSQVTQKKKQASKKTRKGVNEECERLESELKERQRREIDVFNGEVTGEEELGEGLEELALKVDGEETAEKDEQSTATGGPSTAAQDEQAPAPVGQPKKRNRQKDRLARRAAEQEQLAHEASLEAQNLPDLKEQERQRILSAMKEHKLVEKEIRADGHCLYSAVADQLDQLDIPITANPDEKPAIAYKAVRARAAEYISTHQDDFVPFLEEPLGEYVHKVKDTAEWGGQLELLALAKTYGVDINVIQDFGRVEKIEGGDGKEKTIWLGYYKHGFGLGEHYNSLRKIP